ncbi:hypothetical protein ACJX0J_023675, partial [Zea mays]
AQMVTLVYETVRLIVAELLDRQIITFKFSKKILGIKHYMLAFFSSSFDKLAQEHGVSSTDIFGFMFSVVFENFVQNCKQMTLLPDSSPCGLLSARYIFQKKNILEFKHITNVAVEIIMVGEFYHIMHNRSICGTFGRNATSNLKNTPRRLYAKIMMYINIQNL